MQMMILTALLIQADEDAPNIVLNFWCNFQLVAESFPFLVWFIDIVKNQSKW